MTDEMKAQGIEDGASEMQDKARNIRMAGNISSTISGNRAGEISGDKKINLINAMREAEPQLGRRPTPENDPWPKRKIVIRGIALCLVVCIAVVALVIVLGHQGGSNLISA